MKNEENKSKKNRGKSLIVISVLAVLGAIGIGVILTLRLATML